MDELKLIKEQLESYHLGLDLRQHAGVAAQNFVQNVEKILNAPWVQGEAVARAGKGKTEVKTNDDAGSADKEKGPRAP